MVFKFELLEAPKLSDRTMTVTRTTDIYCCPLLPVPYFDLLWFVSPIYRPVQLNGSDN